MGKDRIGGPWNRAEERGRRVCVWETLWTGGEGRNWRKQGGDGVKGPRDQRREGAAGGSRGGGRSLGHGLCVRRHRGALRVHPESPRLLSRRLLLQAPLPSSRGPLWVWRKEGPRRESEGKRIRAQRRPSPFPLGNEKCTAESGPSQVVDSGKCVEGSVLGGTRCCPRFSRCCPRELSHTS